MAIELRDEFAKAAIIALTQAGRLTASVNPGPKSNVNDYMKFAAEAWTLAQAMIESRPK